MDSSSHAATVDRIFLIPRGMPNRGDPDSANPSFRSPALKTEDQKRLSTNCLTGVGILKIHYDFIYLQVGAPDP